MPTPATPYDAVLHAARDVAKVDTALDAELLGAALLGSVYAIADSERAAAVRAFVGGFLAHTSRRRTPAARAIRAVFAALAPDAAGTASVRPGADPPRWLTQIGRVRLVETWAYGDVYGDQTSYLAIFAYENAELGGPEHAVVALVDHNIGIVKDMFVSRPGRTVLERVRAAAEADELVWLTEVAPDLLRERVSGYLSITDGLSSLPEAGSLATDRALVAARLATLPHDPGVVPSVPGAGPETKRPGPETKGVGPRPSGESADGGAEPGSVIAAFLDSTEVAGLDRSTPEAEASLEYSLRLIVDFAREAPDQDPLRWSPAVAGLFLLDWIHRRAVLDPDDVAALPLVLRAWVRWAGARRGLPSSAVAATEEAIETMTPELVRLHGTGERRGEAARAMTALLADGVDPGNPDALQNWLDSHTNGHHPPT